MTTTVTFSPACHRGRPYLWLFCVYALVASTSLFVYPAALLEFPLLAPIERLTGLPRMQTPTTPDEQRYISIFGLFGAAIGLMYALAAGPYWRYGGKFFVQASIDGRLIFAVTAVSVCFFTSHGSSCLLLIAVGEATVALGTQAMAGSRKELYGHPDGGEIRLAESEEAKPSMARRSRSKAWRNADDDAWW